MIRWLRGHNPRFSAKHVGKLKVFVLITWIFFFFALPFLPVIYPRSEIIQLVLGRGRFILVWMILIFALMPLGLRRIDKFRREQSDQETKRWGKGGQA